MREYKVFTQKIGLLGVVNILVSLSSIILLPILTKNLSASDFGIWNQVNVTIVLVQQVALLGFSYSMPIFLAAEKNRDEIREGVFSMLFMVIFSSLIISTLLYLFSGEIGALILGNNLMVAVILPMLLFISNIQFILFDYFRTFQQMKWYSIFTFLRSYIILIAVGILVLLGYGILGCMAGLLISYGGIFLMMLFLMVRDIGITIPKFVNIKEYLSVGLPMVPGGISYWVVGSLDRYIIGIFLGTALVGYYSAGYTLGIVIQLLFTPFLIVLLPVLSESYDDKNKVRDMVEYSMKYFLAIAIPSVFGLSLLSKSILISLTTPEIAANGYLITVFVALGSLLFGVFFIVSQIIVLEKKTNIMGTIWVITAILYTVLNLSLVPYFGILGAALVTLVTYIFLLTFTTFYSFKYFSFSFNILFIAKSLVASILMSLVLVVWNPYGLLNIILACIISGLVYTAILLILKGLSKNEVVFFVGILKELLGNISSLIKIK